MTKNTGFERIKTFFWHGGHTRPCPRLFYDNPPPPMLSMAIPPGQWST